MAYCTVAKVQAACGGSDILRQLSDLENTGEPDLGVVADAIAEADGVIDSYLSKRFAVPLVQVPDSIASLSAGWAVRVLRRIRNKGTPNPADQDADKRDEAWLSKIGSGEVTPGIDPSPTRSPMVIDKAGQRDTSLQISLRKLDGFV